MKKDYILIIDSGIGGLSTLSEIYKKLPANFIYFADNKHAPYGNHSNDEIYEFLKEIIDSVCLNYKIVMVVLACNTATTSAIDKLRNEFSGIKFIGTEPAIKLAYKLNYKHILSVATPTTIKTKKYKHLASSLNVCIKNLALSSFASIIEEYFVSRSIFALFCMQKNIYEIVRKSRNCDCLCLGCTHYIFVKNNLKKITKLPAFDGNFGVFKQVLFWHAKLGIKKESYAKVKFLVSNQTRATKEIYKKIFYEILAKV